MKYPKVKNFRFKKLKILPLLYNYINYSKEIMGTATKNYEALEKF